MLSTHLGPKSSFDRRLKMDFPSKPPSPTRKPSRIHSFCRDVEPSRPASQCLSLPRCRSLRCYSSLRLPPQKHSHAWTAKSRRQSSSPRPSHATTMRAVITRTSQRLHRRSSLQSIAKEAIKTVIIRSHLRTRRTFSPARSRHVAKRVEVSYPIRPAAQLSSSLAVYLARYGIHRRRARCGTRRMRLASRGHQALSTRASQYQERPLSRRPYQLQLSIRTAQHRPRKRSHFLEAAAY